ncbi:MAG: hypothetical protein NE330_08995 [Lentisphaeraceae bacterium]|nr:hypothetical protein [Lentisphaeraceae bacterium]
MKALSLSCLLLLFLFQSLYAGEAINQNPNFENGLKAWVVYKGTGIGKTAKVEHRSTSGENKVFMRLPKEATLNQSQYVKIGQYLRLSKNKKYSYKARVKWLNPSNKLSSAIVSAWCFDAQKAYNGQDVWVKNGKVTDIEFEFSPNATGVVDCYLALLTHQEGFDNTDIEIHSISISEIGAVAKVKDPRPRRENLILNGGFDESLNHWFKTSYNPLNVNGLEARVISKGDPRLHLELPSASSNTKLNNTWSGYFQTVKLYAGNTYILSASVDRVIPQNKQYPTILNMFAYKPKTDLSAESWLGSVDYKFNRSDKHQYSQEISPTETTEYMITVRVFGWGNEGRPFVVNVDNITLKRK